MNWNIPNYSTGTKCKLLAGNFERAISPNKPASRFKKASELIRNLEMNEEHRKGLSDARAWLGAFNESTQPKTIKTVRQGLGLSQQRLAEMIGSSQSHIARIEGGREDIRLSTLRKLSAAMNLSLPALADLIANQDRINEEALR